MNFYFKSIVLETTIITTPSTEETTVATTSVPPSTVATTPRGKGAVIIYGWSRLS